MGLRQNLIDAELEAAKIAGSDITEPTPAMIKKAELTTNAIVDFLTQAKFTVTKFNAPIILEDFMIPPQKGDILTSENIKIIRPNHGLKPFMYEKILGKKVLKNLKAGNPLKLEHIKK